MLIITECRNPEGSRDNAARRGLRAGIFDTPEECSAACTGNADCEIWVYFSDTVLSAAKRKQCWLRWNLRYWYDEEPGIITGPKGCP